MFILLFSLAVAAIFSQSVHTWFVFDSFSQIKQKWLKITQSILFCGIISVFILAAVWMGKETLALVGALVEFIFNVYYYALEFWENGAPHRTGTTAFKKSVWAFWRRYWIRFFAGLIIPASIYIISKLMLEYK